MTDEAKELGRRAIACRAWKWLDGMLTIQLGCRYEERFDAFLVCKETDLGDVTEIDADLESVESDSLPDFSDPATLGCLLALVRAALQDDTIYVRYFPNEDLWCVGSGRFVASSIIINDKYAEGKSEAEALLVVLETIDALGVKTIDMRNARPQ